jgi:acetylxylan esterase
MQVFHGKKDDIINVQNYYEQVDLWTAVLGTGREATLTSANTPLPGWEKKVYGKDGLFESFLSDTVTHDIPDMASDVLRFFELNCTANCFSRKTLAGLGRSAS